MHRRDFTLASRFSRSRNLTVIFPTRCLIRSKITQGNSVQVFCARAELGDGGLRGLIVSFTLSVGGQENPSLSGNGPGCGRVAGSQGRSHSQNLQQNKDVKPPDFYHIPITLKILCTMSSFGKKRAGEARNTVYGDLFKKLLSCFHFVFIPHFFSQEVRIVIHDWSSGDCSSPKLKGQSKKDW